MGTGRYLIIEDDDAMALALVLLVHQHRLGTASVARTAVQARAYLGDGTLFSAMVIDIGLPDGSGLDVLAEAREGAHAHTPALVFTGSCDGAHVNRAMGLRAKYLVKPLGWDVLAAFLRNPISLTDRVDIALRSFPDGKDWPTS